MDFSKPAAGYTYNDIYSFSMESYAAGRIPYWCGTFRFLEKTAVQWGAFPAGSIGSISIHAFQIPISLQTPFYKQIFIYIHIYIGVYKDIFIGIYLNIPNR
jgi:hypothetical protein